MQRLVVLLFIFSSTFSISQNQFTAGLTGGLVTSQIHGDNDQGYHKLGFVAGGLVSTTLTEEISAQFEIYYINKGSRNSPPKGTNNYWIIRLNYIEIPITINYQFKKFKPEIGIAYARLINQKFIQNGFEFAPNTQQVFKKSEISVLAGINYSLTETLDANLRFSQSFLPVRGYAVVVPRFGIFGGSYNNMITLTLKKRFVKHTD